MICRTKVNALLNKAWIMVNSRLATSENYSGEKGFYGA